MTKPSTFLLFTLFVSSLVAPFGVAFAATPASASTAKAVADDWPDTSLFHLESGWLNQEGKSKTLADFGGKHIVVALIFTHCQFSCPVTIAHLKTLQKKLTPKEVKNTHFVLVTLDPARDTPTALKAFAKKRDLPGATWTLLHGEPDVIRDFSVALQMRFKETGKGEFSHGRAISILSPEGTIVYQGQDTDEELAILRKASSR